MNAEKREPPNKMWRNQKTSLTRNPDASDNLELLLISSIGTVVVVRLALAATGYPSVGGATLHIAHVLWGGLALLVSTVIMICYNNSGAMRVASLFAGVGFGLFVDELGKFVTRNNNYFYKPALALIYVIFILLFAIFRRIAPPRTNPARTSTQPGRLERVYTAIVHSKIALRIVTTLFVLQSLLLLLSLLLIALAPLFGANANLDLGSAGNLPVFILAVIASLASSAFTLAGAYFLFRSRPRAYQMFMRATLINIFLVQPFSFYDDQLSALFSLASNLIIYVILRYAIHHPEKTPAR